MVSCLMLGMKARQMSPEKMHKALDTKKGYWPCFTTLSPAAAMMSGKTYYLSVHDKRECLARLTYVPAKAPILPIAAAMA